MKRTSRPTALPQMMVHAAYNSSHPVSRFIGL